MTRTAITFDIDWAPDFVIDQVAGLLAERSVKSTWFVTHASPAVQRLSQRPDLFELGIHPNFLPGSSHGDTPEQVLDSCLKLVPDAVSMRTHGLVQSGALFDLVMSATPIRNELSLFMPMATSCTPFAYRRFGRQLTRIPFMWEDDYVMEAEATAATGRSFAGLAALAAPFADVAVFNFHPIHVYLNSSAMTAYQNLKKAVPRLTQATEAEIRPFVNRDGVGTRSALIELADVCARADGGYFARELAT